MKENREWLVEKQKLSCCLQGCTFWKDVINAWPSLWYVGLNELSVYFLCFIIKIYQPVLCDTTEFGLKRYQYFQEGNFETNTNTNTPYLKNSIPKPIPIPLIQKIRYQYHSNTLDHNLSKPIPIPILMARFL